ncbi:glycosyltransferase family 4 protein [bacterium]|nr:glycosyltransferase family 4 protein [bacterium]
MNKKKVLMLSDHALSTSGVGTQSRFLIQGLISKNRWTFRQFGAALKHTDYETVVINEDFVIKPIDGFGNPDLLRVALATEKPDVLFLFTDPRFFIWLFEMEDEVHQVCPIVWWHVWDNGPYPEFNDSIYKATDLLNCHSHMTYELIKDRHPGKVNFIPHAVPEEIYFEMPDEEKKSLRAQVLGPGKEDWFVGTWINRNAKRKRPSDLLESWKIFVDNLEKTHGHRKACLIMHTDPLDNEGPNLFAAAEMLGISDSVWFSTDRLEFEKINALYNISDFCINVSLAEGFGLGTLEAMMTGTPIIAPQTGGLTRQVVDHRDGTHNGVALPIEFKSLVGSQGVPYIYEDYVSSETIASGIMKLYENTPEERDVLSKKVKNYAKTQFGVTETVDRWDATMHECLEEFKKGYKAWRCEEI